MGKRSEGQIGRAMTQFCSKRRLLQGVPSNLDVGRPGYVDGRGEARLSGEKTGHAKNKSSKDMAFFEN